MPTKKPRFTKPPTYRSRPGRNQALVTLTDAATGRRRDYWLGEYGSPESREQYHRLIAEWEARGRRWPVLPGDGPPASGPAAMTIDELLVEYRRWAESYYGPGQIRAIKSILRLLRRYYGTAPVVNFGPKMLRVLRGEMIRGDPASDPPRRPWARTCINTAIKRIRHVFKWAVGQELVPPAVYQALVAVEPLTRGRATARETDKVGPAPADLLKGAYRFMSRPVRALVRLQLLTGARAGELLGLRACDLEIDSQAGIWVFRPEQHKNAFREQVRTIYIGPRAQRILRRFVLGRPTTAYLFSPAEADAARRAQLNAKRKTPLNQGNRPGSNRAESPLRRPGDRYTTASYHGAIQYACDKAFPPPAALAQRPDEGVAQCAARLKQERRWDELKAWRREHRWHPHQLRHNAATALRRGFGLEAAQLALGHSSATVTDAVYAERDQTRVMEIMRKIG